MKNLINLNNVRVKINNPNLNDGYVRYTTRFFRYDLNWNLLAETIKDNFQPNTPIYVGACSRGSEACGLKMLLEKIAPDKKFPILAFDI